jgi:DNA-binding NarL/FixJ family response regulator
MLAATEALLDEHVAGEVELASTGSGALELTGGGPAGGIGESRLDALLTEREIEVLRLMAGGGTNGQIAARLVISEGTVKSHVKHILRKLRASNRAEAVSQLMKLGG